MKGELEHKIKNVIMKVFGLTGDLKVEGYSISNIGSWDSLGHIKLILTLEKEFKVQFSSDEVVEMVEYTKIKEIVQGKIKIT